MPKVKLYKTDKAIKKYIASRLEKEKQQRIAYYASPEMVALREETEKQLDPESSYFLNCTNGALYPMFRSWLELTDDAQESDLLDDQDRKILSDTYNELERLERDLGFVGIENFVLPIAKRNELRMTLKYHVYPYVMS